MDDAGPADHAGQRRRASASSSARASAGSPRSSGSTRRCSRAGRAGFRRSSSPRSIINLASGQVSIRFGAKGPNLATCTACSASAHAVGESFEIIKRGDADAMIAGGSEAAITPMSVGGFAALRALSTRNDEPQRASRPFDTRSRRLRHRRRRRRAGPGRARVAPGAAAPASTPRWSATAVGRRVPHHRAVRGRRRRRPRDADGAPQGRHRPVRGGLHQRPRHVDALQRPARDAGDQDDCFGEHARRARDLVHQVDDRAPARRGAAGSRPASRRWRCTTRWRRRPSTWTARIRTAISTTCRSRSARCRCATRCRTRSASAAPTRRCC